jgi:site-specific recombinase XerD
MVIYNTLTSSQSNTRSEQSVEHCGEESRSPIATRTQPHTPTADRRHSYVSHLTENGVDRRFIQVQVGHECDSSTAIYTHVSDDFMNTMLQKALSPAFDPIARSDKER